MKNRLVTPTFSTGINDAIATIDAYKNKVSSTINILPDIEDTAIGETLNIIKSGDFTKDLQIKNYLTGITANTASFGIDKDSILKGIVASNNDLLSSLKSLSPSLQAGLTAAKGISKVAITINGITKLIKGADLTSLTGLGNMIKSISGAQLPISFKDKSGLTNLCSNLVKECEKIGIPKSFSTLSNAINDSTISLGMVKNLGSYVIETSSSSLLADISSTPFGKSLYTYNPSFIDDFVSIYKEPSKLFTQKNLDKYTDTSTIFTQENIDKYNAVKEYTTITDSFDKINPGWDMTRNVSTDETSMVSHEERLADFNKISASLRVVDPNYEHADELTMEDKLVEYYAISDSLKNIQATNPDAPDILLDEKLLEYNELSASLKDLSFLDKLDTTFDDRLADFQATSASLRNLDPTNPDAPDMTMDERLAEYEEISKSLKEVPIEYPETGDLTLDERLAEYNRISDSLKNIDNLDENNLSLDDRLAEYHVISESLRTIDDSVITELTLDERLAEYEKISESLKSINDLDINVLTIEDRLAEYNIISESLRTVKDLDIGEATLDEKLAEYEKISESLRTIKELDSSESYSNLKLDVYKEITDSLENINAITVSNASMEKKTSIFSDVSYSFESIKVKYTEQPEIVPRDESLNANVFSKISDGFKSIMTKAADAIAGIFDTSDPSNVNSAANTSNDKYLLLASEFGNPTALSELKRQFPRVIFK